MEKPITVAREDFVNDLVSLINNSQLPMFVVLDVLRSTTDEVREAAKRQYEVEKEKYKKSLEENKEESEAE